MVCFYLSSFSCLSKAILEFNLNKFMLFNPRSYGAPISNRLQCSLEIVRALQCNPVTIVYRILARGNYITMQDTFMISNVPQFYGLTACPSIHEYHWFILARLGYVGQLLSPLVTEVIISTDTNAFVFPCINSTH